MSLRSRHPPRDLANRRTRHGPRQQWIVAEGCDSVRLRVPGQAFKDARQVEVSAGSRAGTAGKVSSENFSYTPLPRLATARRLISSRCVSWSWTAEAGWGVGTAGSACRNFHAHPEAACDSTTAGVAVRSIRSREGAVATRLQRQVHRHAVRLGDLYPGRVSGDDRKGWGAGLPLRERGGGRARPRSASGPTSHSALTHSPPLSHSRTSALSHSSLSASLTRISTPLTFSRPPLAGGDATER